MVVSVLIVYLMPHSYLMHHSMHFCCHAGFSVSHIEKRRLASLDVFLPRPLLNLCTAAYAGR
jgi:hypothetical protein